MDETVPLDNVEYAIYEYTIHPANVYHPEMTYVFFIISNAMDIYCMV